MALRENFSAHEINEVEVRQRDFENKRSELFKVILNHKKNNQNDAIALLLLSALAQYKDIASFSFWLLNDRRFNQFLSRHKDILIISVALIKDALEKLESKIAETEFHNKDDEDIKKHYAELQIGKSVIEILSKKI